MVVEEDLFKDAAVNKERKEAKEEGRRREGGGEEEEEEEESLFEAGRWRGDCLAQFFL